MRLGQAFPPKGRRHGNQWNAAHRFVRRRIRTGSGGKSFATDEPAQNATAAPLVGTGPLAAVDTILALQGLTDGDGQSDRGTRHGEQLLDLLDRVRDGLLTGAIPRTTLNRPASVVSQRRETVADSHLQSVLDEIELRARVELAKLQQADRRTVQTA